MGERQRIRVISAIAPPIGMVTALTAVRTDVWPVFLIAACLAVLAYALARLGHTVWAGFALAIAFVTVPYFGVWTVAPTTSPIVEVGFLLLGGWIAVLVLPMRFATPALGAHLGFVAMAASLNPEIPVDTAIEVMALLGLSAVLGLGWSYINALNLDRLRTQAKALADSMAARAAADAHRRRAAELAATNQALLETQAELVQSSKLAALGRLSGSIVAEIDRPLQMIARQAYGLQHEAGPGPLYARAGSIRAAATRCTELLSGLYDFSRPSDGTQRVMDVRRVVLAATRVFQGRAVRDGIRIVTDMPQPLPVRANGRELAQAILNVLLNASEAMGPEGTIRITGVIDDGEVQVAIRDDGPGMAPDVLDRIFEPFYTTRDREGAGLGLSVTWRIARAHKGRVEARSVPGHGTEITLVVPVADDVFSSKQPEA